ncbi:hypothetical protein [Vibrio vulnificus]|uniref:hypothetical protein n=1 Tax=Vibrio vulnificus TaxID=672 RepID=UPI000CD0D602|nr:hypothetical protein [Vibrio vulnificus]POB76825.1 hypothetical protein CRN30_22165 [Vibrio vulnificus]
MKKYLSLLMTITLSIALSGCNGSSDSSSELAESYDGVYKDKNGESLFYSSYTKLPTLADFDLMYQSYADWERMTLIFSNDDRMFAQLDFMLTCQLNADVKRMSNFYRVSNGAITCNDPNDPRIDSNMHGVIYKVAEDSRAVVIVQGKRWTYRTTFQTVY